VTRGRPFDSRLVVADTSARLRVRDEAVGERWHAALGQRQIATSAVVTLELLHTARNAIAVSAVATEEATLRAIPLTRSIHQAAVGAVCELSRRGSGYHRVALPDVLIAAAAQEAGADVLHYDHHFDRLAEVLHFRSIWVAPAGSLS
jgi:predicted nucleic acid-binding protein